MDGVAVGDGIGAVDCAACGAGAGLCVLTGVLGAALGGATGAGSTYAGLGETAVMEAGAIGGSSERSWRESSGSGMSSNAATECVGAIGAGAGATSDGSEIAEVDDAAIDDGSADGSRRGSEPVLAVDVVTDFAHRPDVDAVPAAVGAAEGATPVGGTDTGVGWAANAGEPPGFAGRGGAFAAGGGEAAGAGRAGGIVGIADFGTGFAAVAERAAIAGPAGGAVGDAADGTEGRLASADVVDVGFAAAAGRVAEALGAAELATRAGAAAEGADARPDAAPDPCAVVADPYPDAVVADPGNADPAAEAIFDARAWAVMAPVDAAPVFAGAADVRGAAPGGGVCATADFDAAADVFEAGGVASAEVAAADEAPADDEAAASGDFREPEADVFDADVAASANEAAASGDFREPEADVFDASVAASADEAAAKGDFREPEVDVEDEAERVGGTGESPDPSSEASSMGEAQVPEYAASEGAAAVTAADESAAAALEVFRPVVAELANTGPEAFAATAA